jgi:hypothetical protein
VNDIKPQPPVRGVISIEQMTGDDPEDTGLLRSMAGDAENYLRSFAWCRAINAKYFGAGVGGVIGIFLFGIVPSQAGVDQWLWVVVGDIPSAYLVTDVCKVPSEALAGYIREMKRWVELAKEGRSSSDVIPVNVPSTPEWASQLEPRLRELEGVYIPRFREDETERA